MNLLYMNNIEVNALLNNSIFKFAKTMPTMPHYYTLKDQWSNKDKFIQVVKFIYENGISEKFYNTYHRYYYANGYKYWCYAKVNLIKNDMVYWMDKKKIIEKNINDYAENVCILINRAKV
jgi:hypothetical protein